MPRPTVEELQAEFPFVKDWQIEIVRTYGGCLNNTGGNDPLALLNTYYDPAQTGKLVKSNLPVFTLASMVDAQVTLLHTLLRRGVVR